MIKSSKKGENDHRIGSHSLFCSQGQSGSPMKRLSKDGQTYEIFGIHMGVSLVQELQNERYFTGALLTNRMMEFVNKTMELLENPKSNLDDPFSAEINNLVNFPDTRIGSVKIKKENTNESLLKRLNKSEPIKNALI